MLRPQDVEEGEIDKGLAGPMDTDTIKSKADETKEEAKHNVGGLLANVKQVLGFGSDSVEDTGKVDTKSTAHHESATSVKTGGREDKQGEVCFEVRAFNRQAFLNLDLLVPMYVLLNFRILSSICGRLRICFITKPMQNMSSNVRSDMIRKHL